MRNFVRQLFSLSGSTNDPDADVYKALDELEIRLKSWRRLPSFVGWAILVGFAVLVSIDLLVTNTRIMSDPGSLMLISGFVAAGLALIAFHSLIRGIPSTLRILWVNQYIVAGPKDPDVPEQRVGDYSNIRSRTNTTEAGYTRFIRDFESSLNHWQQWVTGLFFALLVVVWTIVPVYFPRLDIPSGDIRSAILVSIIEIPIGLTIGLMAWRMLIVGRQISRIGKQVGFELVPRLAHPDRSGGLDPLGNLILLHVLPISIAGTYLGGWIILGAFAEGSSFGSLAKEYTPWFAWLLSVPIALAAFSFVVPLWSLHQIMVYKRDEALKQLAEDVDSMTRQILNRGDQMAAEEYERFSKNLEIKQKNYLQQYKGYPLWPVNLGTSAKFLIAQFLPVFGGLVGLFKAVS